jgi:hypothetical protein
VGVHARRNRVLFSLFIVFVAAQIGTEIAGWLKIPAVVGEIAASCIIGPSAFGWIHINEPLTVLAEIGAVLLLFSVGLETRVADLREVGKVAGLVGISGVVLPFIMGAAWAMTECFTTPKSLFIAVVSKLVGCGWGAFSLGRKPLSSWEWDGTPRRKSVLSWQVSVNRWEFLRHALRVLIAMSLLTSVIAPPLVKALLASSAVMTR